MFAAPALTIPIPIPIPSVPSCPGGSVDPLCGLAGVGSGLIGDSANSVLQAVTSWVIDGASWLLGQIGAVLSSTTSVDIGAPWFVGHYKVMVGLAGIVVLPMLLCSLIQSIYRQSPGTLARSVLVQLPLALLLSAAMVELVRLGLAVTDELGSAVTSGSGTDIATALGSLAKTLVTQTASGQQVPAFVALLAGLLVAFGSFLLWVELLVRAAAVYVAVLFLPLALASMVWPAVSHWCRRLVDTLVALILTKFVIVTILSLAVGALGSGTSNGFAGVLAGGALLMLAAFTPFTLLRLIPAVEAGAALQLEGARHRVQQSLSGVPRSAAAFALKAAGSSSFAPGQPGSAAAEPFEAPGTTDSTAPAGVATRAGNAPAGPESPAHTGLVPTGNTTNATGAPPWRGDPASNLAFERALANGHGESPPPVPMPVLSSPVPAGSDRPGPGVPGENSTTHRASPGSHRIGHDELGPVITWVPPHDNGAGARGRDD